MAIRHDVVIDDETCLQIGAQLRSIRGWAAGLPHIQSAVERIERHLAQATRVRREDDPTAP